MLGLVAALVTPLQIGDRVPSTEAKKHVGTIATICGRVVTYDCRESDRTTFLDLDRPYWQKGVAIVIGAADRARIGLDLEDRYLQRDICATGPVEKRDGRYLVSVRDTSQLRVEAEPPFPPIALPADTGRFCNGGVAQPSVIKLERPTYTRAAAQAWVEGKVFLDAVVLQNGSVDNVRPLYSDFDPVLGLEQRAVAAVKASRFRAGTINGQPAPVVVTLEMLFTMR